MALEVVQMGCVRQCVREHMDEWRSDYEKCTQINSPNIN